MNRITLDVPDETMTALGVKREDVGATLRMAAAAKLFELDRLSSGAAAALAGVPRPLFLARLGDFGVDTFRLTREELEREVRFG